MAKEKRLYAMWSENKNNRHLVGELQKKVGDAQRQMHDRTERGENVLVEFERRLQQINKDNDERIEQTMWANFIMYVVTYIDLQCCTDYV